jgi:hypothetical protein
MQFLTIIACVAGLAAAVPKLPVGIVEPEVALTLDLTQFPEIEVPALASVDSKVEKRAGCSWPKFCSGGICKYMNCVNGGYRYAGGTACNIFSYPNEKC